MTNPNHIYSIHMIVHLHDVTIHQRFYANLESQAVTKKYKSNGERVVEWQNQGV
jgi:hypothetical protein